MVSRETDIDRASRMASMGVWMMRWRYWHPSGIYVGLVMTPLVVGLCGDPVEHVSYVVYPSRAASDERVMMP